MKFHKSKKDILNGNITEQILLFTIPIMGSYLIQQLYQFVDSIALGRYASIEALAAVGGSASMIINVLLNIVTGIATGVMIVVAQSYGRGNMERLRDSVKTGMFISVIFGGIISIISALLANPLLHLMKCPEETIPLSLIYLFLNFAGIIPYMIYMVGTNILRASGDTRISLFFTIIIASVKIVLDLILTVVYKMGVWGVSISTLAAYLVCGIAVLVILYKTPNQYHYDIRSFGCDFDLLKTIFKLGTPIAIQSAVFAITSAFVSVRINEQGTNSIAAYSIYTNIDNLYWSFSSGLGTAIVTIAGQNYGNKNLVRVKQTLKYGILINIVAVIIFGAFEYFACPYIAFLFTDNIEVMNIAEGMVKLIAISYAGYILVETVSSTIKACGDSMNSMIIAIIGICVVRFIYLSVFKFTDVNQVIMCYPISWIITSIIYLIYYLLNKKYRLAKSN